MSVERTFDGLLEESARLESAGDFARAMEQATEALARAAGHWPNVVAALNRVGLLHFRIGQYAEAQALAEEALAHTGEDTQAHVDALLLKGMCATETDDLDAGEDCYRRAFDLSRRLGYKRAVSGPAQSRGWRVCAPRTV